MVLLIVTLKFPVANSEAPIALDYYVTDSAGVLGYDDLTSIENLEIEIENDTSAQFAVYVVNTTGTMSIEDFSVKTFELSQLGQAGVDNGLLLVVAVNDRHWKIEVGYGLEGVLNDAKVGSIGRTYLDPAFQSGDYGEGIYNTLYALGGIVLNSDVSRPADYPIPGIPLNWWQLVVAAVILIVLLIITRGGIFLWVLGMFRRGGGGRSGGGGAKGEW